MQNSSFSKFALVVILLATLIFVGCTPSTENNTQTNQKTNSSQSANDASISMQVSGEHNETIIFDEIYCGSWEKSQGRDIAVTLYARDHKAGFPTLQINIRGTEKPVSTYKGGIGSKPNADIQLSYSATEYYTTYDSANFQVTLDSFDPETGLSGSYTISDGGVLPNLDGDKQVTVSPTSANFKCSCVHFFENEENTCSRQPIS